MSELEPEDFMCPICGEDAWDPFNGCCGNPECPSNESVGVV